MYVPKLTVAEKKIYGNVQLEQTHTFSFQKNLRKAEHQEVEESLLKWLSIQRR